MKKHIIKNYSQLAQTELRRMALEIAEAGLRAVLPQVVLQEKIKLENGFLIIKENQGNPAKKYLLSKFSRVFLLAIGKAGFQSALVIKKKLKKRINQIIVLDPTLKKDKKTKKEKLFSVSHPLPSLKNIQATEEILNLAKNLKSDDLVILIISGGGSASLCYPKITLSQSKKIFQELTKRGATIEEINTVRKHLSGVKGGHLAKILYPAKVIALILSDVPGNNLSVIASGPTVMDKTTSQDAQKVIKKYRLEKKLPIKFFETPKEKKYFQKVDNILILSNLDALYTMKKKAQEFGFKSKILTDRLEGEAKKIGKRLVSLIKSKQALLAGGETTVKITGKGKGGRNLEVCLGALEKIKKNQILISLASDGKDNTPSAGAIADFLTKNKAQNLKLSPDKYLKNNDSYHFFQKTGDLILTGPTGTNVADLVLVLSL